MTVVGLDVDAALTAAFRREWGRVVGAVIAATGDWDLAEECAQEAYARAARRWPVDGVPARPGAWLTTTARRHAWSRLKRAAVEKDKVAESVARALPTVTGAPAPAGDDDLGDPLLRLIFTCCHPALSPEARIALTLRTVTGLTTTQIARAFLVSESAMAQRLVRAQRKIKQAGIPYRVPPAHLLGERTGSVLSVLYLLFNEGHAATVDGEVGCVDLCDEAVHLTRLLSRAMPREPECLGLLALMLLTAARRGGRVDTAGELVPLMDQDRALWDPDVIAEGLSALDRARILNEQGPYQLQAEIAACHSAALHAPDTDWLRIAGLYSELAVQTRSPVVELNRAVAIAMVDGPAAGLAVLDGLADSRALEGYHLLPATRGDLLRRLGRYPEAAQSYLQALDRAPAAAERRFLTRRLADLDLP